MKFNQKSIYVILIACLVIGYILYANLYGYFYLNNKVSFDFNKAAFYSLPLPEKNVFIIKEAGWGYICMAFSDMNTKSWPLENQAPGFILNNNLCIYNKAIRNISTIE